MNYKAVFILILSIIIGFGCNPQNQDKDLNFCRFSADSLKTILAPDGRVARIYTEFSLSADKLIIKGETSIPEFKFTLLQLLEERGHEIIDSLITLPHPDLNEINWGLINVSVANLRSQPGHSKEMVTQAIMGTPLRILKKNGVWYYIQTPDSYLAWVDNSAMQLLSKSDLEKWNQGDRVLYQNDFGVIRVDKSNSSLAVSDIVFGCILSRAKNEGKWLKVGLPDGRQGYLLRKAVTDFEPWVEQVVPIPDEMLEIAYNMIGRPYLWGGTSTKGMDCSGFVKTLYYSGGLILARDASQQIYQGDMVDTEAGFEKLQKGDLLFFGRKGSDSQKERITHVGMYIDKGRYIHSSGKIKINSFNPEDDLFSQYLVDIFVRARRIIGSDSKYYPVSLSTHPWYN